jgi:hypothetical protein
MRMRTKRQSPVCCRIFLQPVVIEQKKWIHFCMSTNGVGKARYVDRSAIGSLMALCLALMILMAQRFSFLRYEILGFVD